MSDNREILNDAEVDFLLSAAATDEAQAPPTEIRQDSQLVTMRGDLDQIQLADIFQTLAMSKMEGVLLVRNPLEERQVYCHNGTVRIKVPPRVALRRLGQRLVQAGLLEPEQLRSTLVLQRKERLPLGELLVQEGLLTQDQIDEVAGMQVAEDLFALFTWRHGTFEFYKGELTNQEQRTAFEVCPEFEVNSLLLEVARRSDEWECILAAIGSLDEVPHRIAEPANPEDLDESHRTLLYGADGHATYRSLAEQTTHSLFEVARAARDLVNGGLIQNVDDVQLAQVAMQHAEEAQEKRAIVLLQTLRDRPGDRSVDVVQTMAAALERAGERKLAGTVLLEAAQQQSDGEAALAMARRARDLAPRDAGTNSFLRTILLAHSAADSPELERVTVDLIDALLEADLTSTALEIIEDARATGTLRPQILVREVRARQKARDAQGAVQALLELADVYTGQGDRPRTIETLESILRIDRSHVDVRKRLALMRQTRIGRIVRLCATILCIGLLSGMGVVFWRQNAHDTAVQQADADIGALLGNGDRPGARARLEHWHEVLGDCEAVDDLRSRIDFAEAAEHTRIEKTDRRRVADRLTEAGTALADGEVLRSMAIYVELAGEPKLRQEVTEAASSRLGALLDNVEQVAKSIAHGLPPEPSTLIDRRDLTAHRTDLHAICPPRLLVFFEGLERAESELPELLPLEQRQRVAALLPQTRSLFAHAAHLTAAYDAALARNEHERRLDPMFKAAVDREASFDFAGALGLFRQLEAAPAGDAQLKEHFRERIARNAAICSGLDALAQATAGLDFATAQQQYRALQTAYPEVPFARLVRLPLRIDSYPPGATVTCNGVDVGKTPLALTYIPVVDNKIAVQLAGFRPTQTSITGDTTGHWIGHLILEPARTLAFEHPVEQAPAMDGDGNLYFTDRGGAVTCLAAGDGKVRWRFATGDLSGYLSSPVLRGDELLVTSLDGELRALNRTTGVVAWSLPDLPVEVAPVLIDKYLIVATTDARMVCIDLDAHVKIDTNLPEATHGELLAEGSTLISVGTHGIVSAFTLPGLTPAWQHDLQDMPATWSTVAGGNLLVTDDRGRLRCLDVATGNQTWSRDLDVEVLGAPVVLDHHCLVVTPESILRFDLTTGDARAGIDRLDAAWAGPMQRVSGRLVLPVAGGSMQVIDEATGKALYRLDASKRGSRCRARNDRLYVMQRDRSVDCYPQLR